MDYFEEIKNIYKDSKMKLEEIQTKLDKRKWVESSKYNRDLSGLMNYCAACKWQGLGTCRISQNSRAAGKECAKAYIKAIKMGVDKECL